MDASERKDDEWDRLYARIKAEEAREAQAMKRRLDERVFANLIVALCTMPPVEGFQ